jgi:NADH:ubiquinone oxidoreductase subunit 2 (subunit N)
MEILVRTHSGLRWIVLGLLIYALINAFTKKDSYEKSDRLLNMFAMVSLHIQLVIGLILYFTSSKVSFVEGWMSEKTGIFRFYGMEHILLMIIAIVIVTIGHGKAKRATENTKKHKTIALFYTIGLILILASIPWPFRNLGAGWF